MMGGGVGGGRHLLAQTGPGPSPSSSGSFLLLFFFFLSPLEIALVALPAALAAFPEVLGGMLTV